ncbi:MAG TPA: 1-acyl-sn-glycerol-3-phosphate acyltransferase [Candidatus Corynebacterium gallistercoris]|uniref:1-acyl-sn-glycerol-3-phosphate acyltransferase n=1 Tax=Candidatus Corynebacterium gallistercoris TaxID=2838530 RepID=A0A9D1RXP5_9CORY|nr:1-acyl-sn-glycerol-3-phosphate acyltransferase [Candidatus Corynebacterium gallistercoris]
MAGIELPNDHTDLPKHREAREPIYGRVIIPLAKLWMRYVQRLDVIVEGVENIPSDGGAMIAVNHTGYWDFVYGGIPAHFRGGRLVRFMAKKEIFNVRGVGWLMRKMKHIPVDRADGQASVDEAIARLKKGQLVGIFPEATISRSFEVKEFRQGAAVIAREAGVPLVPLTIWGSQKIWTKGYKPVWRPKDAKLVMMVGSPVPVGEDAAETTTRLREAMVQQLERTRAVYEERFGAMPAGEHWVPASMGGTAPTLEEATAKDRADAAARKAKRAAEAGGAGEVER